MVAEEGRAGVFLPPARSPALPVALRELGDAEGCFGASGPGWGPRGAGRRPRGGARAPGLMNHLRAVLPGLGPAVRARPACPSLPTRRGVTRQTTTLRGLSHQDSSKISAG